MTDRTETEVTDVVDKVLIAQPVTAASAVSVFSRRFFSQPLVAAAPSPTLVFSTIAT